ncbi:MULTISPECIES: hypothetical protein [unclassified Bradyrhizobium]
MAALHEAEAAKLRQEADEHLAQAEKERDQAARWAAGTDIAHPTETEAR